MEAQLYEDDLARSYRADITRAEGREGVRATVKWAFPICGMASVISPIVLPQVVGINNSEAVWVAILIFVSPVLTLIPVFAFAHRFHRIFRNRWQVSEHSIRLRGEKYGTIQLRDIAWWTKHRLAEIPGYYRIEIYGKRQGSADIILGENNFQWDLIDSIMPIPPS